MPNPLQPRRYPGPPPGMLPGQPPGMPPGPPMGPPPGMPPGPMMGQPPGMPPMGPPGLPPLGGPPSPFPGGPAQFQPPAAQMTPDQLSREYLIDMLRQKPSPEAGATTPRPFVPPSGGGRTRGV